MPKEFQPILLENLQIRWSGFRIRRVALNQHMPRVERLGEHVHRHSQILLYLRGSGTQHLAGTAVPVARGSVLVIPPGRRHRFEKSRTVRPICLVMDFETKEAVTWRTESVLGPRDLSLVERLLVDLHECHRKPDDFSIQGAALILQILALLHRALAEGGLRQERGPVCVSVEKTIAREGLPGLTPGAIAARLGRSLDHLNRQLRAESDATVGTILNRIRLERVGDLLRTTTLSVSEIASAVGMDDQNYFARWFRKHTGQTPTHWREAMRGKT